MPAGPDPPVEWTRLVCDSEPTLWHLSLLLVAVILLSYGQFILLSINVHAENLLNLS